MASMIKSALFLLAAASIATAQVYDSSDAPFDCKSTKSFFSCMATATNWASCRDDACYCKDYEIESVCLSKYCPDTTETYDNDIFAECKTIKETSAPATKPSDAKATPTASSSKAEPIQANTQATPTASPPKAEPTQANAPAPTSSPSKTGKPNAANLVTGPAGGILGLAGVAIGAFL